MKKKLEAELISIAHRVLKLKNRSETVQLQEEAKKLYEQLTILRFYEENIDVIEREISSTDFEEKLTTLTTIKKEVIKKNNLEISADIESKIVEAIEETQEAVEEAIVGQEEALESNE